MNMQAPGFLPTLVQRGVLKLLDLMKVPATTAWLAAAAQSAWSSLHAAVPGSSSVDVSTELKSYAEIELEAIAMAA